MDSKIQKIKFLVDHYLYSNINDVIQSWGEPVDSDDRIVFYEYKKYLVLKDEICFILKDQKIVDIVITNYILGIAIRNTFYNEYEEPRFRTTSLYNFQRFMIRQVRSFVKV